MMKFIHAQITWIALLLYHWLCWIGIDQDWSLIKICFTYVLSLLFFFCPSFLGDTQFWKRCVAFCIKLRKMWVTDKFLHATSLFPKLLCFRNGSCKSNTENDLSEWKNHVRFFSEKCFQDFAVRRRCGEMFIRNGDTYPVVKCSSFWPKTTTRTAHFTSFGRKKKKTSYSFVNNIYNNTYKLTQTSKNSVRLSIHYFDRKLFNYVKNVNMTFIYSQPF